MTSIKDVAKHSGVSIATVSRVLSDKPNIRPEVRERVLKVVEELGYRPNRVASSLRRQTSDVVGVLVSDIRNPFFTAIARAIEDFANQREMSIFLCNTDEDPKKEAQYLHTLADQNVAGIIMSPTPSQAKHFKFIADSKIPVVCIDRRIKGLDTDCVLSDNRNAARLLTDHLVERGYRHIGAVMGVQGSTTGRERMQGYEDSIKAHQLTALTMFATPKEAEGEAVVRQWLASENPPDAIFCGNSRLTIGAIIAIKQAGLSIPEDIALAGFDETIWMPHVGPGITVISQPTYEMGRAAAELLLQRIEKPERSVREVILKGTLIERGSTAHKQPSA